MAIAPRIDKLAPIPHKESVQSGIVVVALPLNGLAVTFVTLAAGTSVTNVTVVTLVVVTCVTDMFTKVQPLSNL